MPKASLAGIDIDDASRKVQLSLLEPRPTIMVSHIQSNVMTAMHPGDHVARMLADADHLPTIRTERLRLRWLTPADVPALFGVFGDAEVCRYWSRPPLRDLAGAAALQQEIAGLFAARTLFQWGIAERGTDAVVGTCTLAALSPGHRRAELGFALARSVWGRGYVAEALPALLRFAFVELDLHRIEADADPRNTRSIRALQRLGFEREGYQRERYFMNGEWQDGVLYGLLRSEWRLRLSEGVEMKDAP